VGVAFGLALHTLIDGVAVGAAVLAEAEHGGAFPLLGVGVFLAVLLHKPMDALAVTALMHASGWSGRAQTLVNLAFAAMCPIGAFAVLYGSQLLQEQQLLIGAALAFSAGVFLWISLGDLLPDVHFHSHDASKFAVALLVGVMIAWGIGYLEPKHAHEALPGAHGHGHSHSHAHE
jgi:zinc and cadmium transporter